MGVRPGISWFGIAALFVGIGVAKGTLIPDGASDAAYVNYGKEFEGRLLGLTIHVPGVGTGLRQTSATFLTDSWAITAAHNVSDLLQYSPTYELSTGSNLSTVRGTIVSVNAVTLFPGYSGGFDSPDIALLHLTTPLQGARANIGSVSVGELTTEAGFGAHGTPSTGILPTDYNSRAFDAPAIPGTSPNVSDAYYFSTDFDSAIGVPLNGKALSGDSGGPVFDPSGNLVGIAVAQSGGTDPLGITDDLTLSQPDVISWIEANSDYGTTPEPSALEFLSIATCGLLGRQRSLRRHHIGVQFG